MQMPRIISLIPSATEIVSALGFEDNLVGRSHECDHPPRVKSLPACTAPKFNPEGTSYEINERVKAIVQEALSVYRVDAAMLEELRPTHIITQSQCEVCAVSLEDVEQVVCQLTSSRPTVVSLEPNSLADVWADIRRVGEALAVPDRAEQLVGRLRSRMSAIREKVSEVGSRPTVACIEWVEPLMSAGNWMPELVDMAGGINLFGEAGQHSPWMQWEELVARDPDIIVVLPCGFDIQRSLEEMHRLRDRAGWSELKAVRSGRVFVTDGNQYFNRPGPRLLESLEIFAELFHPDLFPGSHHGTGWVRYHG